MWALAVWYTCGYWLVRVQLKTRHAAQWANMVITGRTSAGKSVSWRRWCCRVTPRQPGIPPGSDARYPCWGKSAYKHVRTQIQMFLRSFTKQWTRHDYTAHALTSLSFSLFPPMDVPPSLADDSDVYHSPHSHSSGCAPSEPMLENWPITGQVRMSSAIGPWSCST